MAIKTKKENINGIEKFSLVTAKLSLSKAAAKILTNIFMQISRKRLIKITENSQEIAKFSRLALLGVLTTGKLLYLKELRKNQPWPTYSCLDRVY